MLLTVLFAIIASTLGHHCDVSTAVNANKIFTVNVYKELANQSGSDNLIVSGLSAATALSLLANGAKGDTLHQLLKGLSQPDNLQTMNDEYKQILTHLNIKEDHLNLVLANKIYPAKYFSISNKFNATAVEFYNSTVETVDYENPLNAANTINQWVEGQTNHKIQNLIDASLLSPTTLLVIVNALYLSGKWQHEFKKDHTEKGDFHSVTGTKQIDMMFTEALCKYSYNDKLKAKYLELSIVGEQVSVVFILPDSLTGLKEIEENLTEYLEKQDMQDVAVAITLPKFKITSEIDFKPILQSLGIERIFTNQADLSGISEGSKLSVDFVIQKAYIDINEEGIEAAAASAIGISRMSAISGDVKHTFTADHPFLFYIVENDNDEVLFIGRFNN